MMYKSNLKGSMCYELKTYRYVIAGRNMAIFELLMFENGDIGSQGEILATEEKFSPGKIYTDVDNAVQEMINIIEEKIKNDKWVLDTEKYG